MSVSIIICTRDRAADLRQTLASLAGVCVPAMPVELIVADNGSRDETAQVAGECRLPDIAVRHLLVPTPGKGHAYNAALEAARNDVLLFTDDDVRLPADWIARMSAPILAGEADALAGGVRLAPHLERPWMTPLHRGWLASSEEIDLTKTAHTSHLVGANMAFERRVLEKVPAFDTELGPGALGFADETLFSWQLHEAGYKFQSAQDVVVEHWLDPSRLLRANFQQSAAKNGSCLAYLSYHWLHTPLALVRLRMAKHLLQWAAWQLAEGARRAVTVPEGIPVREMQVRVGVSFRRQYGIERRRPRIYDKRGLVKKRF